MGGDGLFTWSNLSQFLLIGQVDPAPLLETARAFPGGPVMLTFLLFLGPAGIFATLGVQLARHVALGALPTFTLYAASDVLTALICAPLFELARRYGRRVPVLHAIGLFCTKLVLIGLRDPQRDDLNGRSDAGSGNDGPGADVTAEMRPVLLRIFTLPLISNLYVAGAVATGADVPRFYGWLAALAGDLLGFGVLLGTSLAASSVANDDKFVGIAIAVALFLVSHVAGRRVPRKRPAAATVRATVAQ